LETAGSERGFLPPLLNPKEELLIYTQGRIVFWEISQNEATKSPKTTSCAGNAKVQPAPHEKNMRGAHLNLSEDCEDMLLVTNFWVCDCGTTYRSEETTTCPHCGHDHDECPDALADELVRYSRHLLTNKEYKEICQELENMRQRLLSRQSVAV
jgi:hypothetical protein